MINIQQKQQNFSESRIANDESYHRRRRNTTGSCRRFNSPESVPVIGILPLLVFLLSISVTGTDAATLTSASRRKRGGPVSPTKYKGVNDGNAIQRFKLNSRKDTEGVPFLLAKSSTSAVKATPSWQLQRVLGIPRCGASEEDDSDVDDDDDEEYDDEDDEEDEDDDDRAPNTATALSLDTTQQMMEEILVVSQKAAMTTFQIMGQAVKVISQALQRSLQAAFMEESDEESELPTLSRFFKGLERMVTALFVVEPPPASSPASAPLVYSVASRAEGAKKRIKGKESRSSEDDMDEEDHDDHENELEKFSSRQAPSIDFGDYLQKAYKLPETENEESSRKSLENPCIIHTGSFSDALSAARSQARLLLILIPCHPGVSVLKKKEKSDDGKSPVSADVAALTAFLSKNVSQMANRKARKNGPKGDAGSFLLWSALPGTPEATAAMKRLQLSLTNSQGSKRPVIAVVYAARPPANPSRLVPKMLAQHHASPPPSPEIMAAWMNALRKRHAARFVQMQKELQELIWHQERKEGYQSSIKRDVEEQKRKAEEEALAEQRRKQEEERQKAILQRRSQLENDLPEEPQPGPNIKTVALRLSSASTGSKGAPQQQDSRLQRRFADDTPLSKIFDWVDVVLELEREAVVLSTLNGKQTYSWTDVAESEDEKRQEGASKTSNPTLADVGSSKMMAFWVKNIEKQD